MGKWFKILGAKENHEFLQPIPETSSPRFIIFFGDRSCPANYYANNWLSENPDAHILDVKYTEAEYRCNSICILYDRKGGEG